MGPHRDLSLRKLERRAIQLGIRGSLVLMYVNHWILGIEDITELAREIELAVKNKQKEIPKVPEERVYEVNPQIQKTLGMI